MSHEQEMKGRGPDAGDERDERDERDEKDAQFAGGDDREPLAMLRGLPREHEPERDLWGDIEAKLARPSATSNSDPRSAAVRGPAPSRWGWAVGGLMAAGLTAFVVVGSLRGSSPTGGAAELASLDEGEAAPDEPMAELAPEEGEVGDELLPGERTYLAASAELTHVLDERRAMLPDGLGEVYDENLAVVDAAIADARTALAADPEDEGLQAALEHAYRQKLELLQQVHDVTVSS